MNTMIGADPEFFFKDKQTGQVIGSEKLIKAEERIYETGTLIRDGVAAEINPDAAYCREVLWANINDLMNLAEARAYDKGATVCFDTTVTLTQENFNALSPISKQFGCVPSQNAYGVMPIPAGSSDIPVRSAGGHIHLGYKFDELEGWNEKEHFMNIIKAGDDTVVKVLDVLVGNTCVLFDQFPGSKERRKTYGRAGEYRSKPYGLEYRTPSNFWLRDYRLFGMAFGLARQALWIVGYNKTEQVLGEVNQDDIIKAINDNDAVLALKNFKKYAPIVATLHSGWNYPLDSETYYEFEKLVKSNNPVGEIGYEMRVEDINHDDFRGNGFESFLAEQCY